MRLRSIKNFFDLNKPFWDKADEAIVATTPFISQFCLYTSVVLGFLFGRELQSINAPDAKAVTLSPFIILGASILAFPALEEKLKLNAHASFVSRFANAFQMGLASSTLSNLL